MNLKELIGLLQAIYDKHGDMPVGHYDNQSAGDYVVDAVEFVPAAYAEGIPGMFHPGRVITAENPDHVMLYGENMKLTKHGERDLS